MFSHITSDKGKIVVNIRNVAMTDLRNAFSRRPDYKYTFFTQLYLETVRNVIITKTLILELGYKVHGLNIRRIQTTDKYLKKF